MIEALHSAAPEGSFATRARITRRSFLASLPFACCALSSLRTSLAEPLAQGRVESLKQAAAGMFGMGVGIGYSIVNEKEEWDLLTSQFGYVTPENCMKPEAVQPADGEFRFSRTDQFVQFATEKELKVVGHCLVWAKDDRTPAWFFQDGDKPASSELLLQRMRRYITTVVGRYRGRIAMWDVVNEALGDGADYIRPSGWERACGERFIAEAFECAHSTDPEALLIYNDYRSDLPDKREKLMRLVRSLKGQGVPIHAMGLQGHYELDAIPFEELRDTFDEARDVGIKVVVSELDIDVVKRGRWWAEGGKYREELAQFDPYRDGCPDEILQSQAAQYAQLFRLYREYADVIERISFWNLHDGKSWLNYFPWRRVNHPLLFDRQMRPKPAFDAVLKALVD